MTTPGAAETRYARLTQAFLGRPNVTQEGKGFGSSALKVDAHIFAMLSSRSEFVVKLPRKRVDELISSGDGLAFDGGKGRPMKEWAGHSRNVIARLDLSRRRGARLRWRCFDSHLRTGGE